MKRFVILFLTLIHCYLSYAQMIVASGIEIDGIYYNLYDDNTCQVCQNYAVRYEGDMVIPETVLYQGTTYTVTEIGDCLADDLTSVSIPKTVTSISSHAFEVVGTTECSLENYYVAEDNPIFTSVDGVIYNKKKDLLCRFPHGRKGAYRVLDNTLQICSEAFCGSVNLTEVTLPASFCGFAYPFLVESDTSTGITGAEFYGCHQLMNINMEPSDKEWGYLSVDGVLYHCANTGYIWQTEELCEWVGSNVWYVWTLSQYPPGRTDETYEST